VAIPPGLAECARLFSMSNRADGFDLTRLLYLHN